MKIFFTSLKAYIKEHKRATIVTTSSTACLAILLSVGAFALAKRSATPPLLVQAGEKDVQEDSGSGFTLTNPTLVSGSSSIIILGKVLSHETANIYPRRDGIVEDVYFDIGDTVHKNQVVALLLPKGVEGQSAAAIAEKNARKVQAESDYVSALGVAQEAVNKANQQIEEKETALAVAQNEQEALKRKFSQYKSNVTQALEQAFISIRRARQLIEQITIGSNTRPGEPLREDDINDQLGLLSPETRYNLSYSFEQLEQAEDEYLTSDERHQQELIESLTSHANDALLKMNDLLAATPTVPLSQPSLFTQQKISNLLSSILSVQNEILKAKEKYEDANNAFITLTSSEPALYSAWKSGSDNPNVKSNKVHMLTAQLMTTKEHLDFVTSQQQQMVEKTKNMVGVADAMLSAQYTISGHREIRSPFSGVISKRFIEVGGMAMPSMPAFELVDVETSLSKIAKNEIQFGLPENLLAALSVGNTVTFLMPNDDIKTYQAEVTRISPQVDMQTHTITVQAKIDDSLNFPNHSNVRVRFVDQKSPTFQVPSFAVKREEEGNILWVLDAKTNKPQKISVTVRSEDGEFAEISGDITEDTQIILDPPDFIASIISLSND